MVERGEAALDRRLGEIEEAKKRKEIEGNVSRYVTNGWLDVTGWDEHLKGFDREQLIELIRPAVGEEPEPPLQRQPQGFEEREGEEGLADACKATRRLIKRAIQTCRPNVVGKEALEHVNRREVGEQTNERPFYARQKVQTIRKYSDHWVKVLRYVWRTHSRARKPPYTLTPRQSRCMRLVKTLCNREDEGTSGESSQGSSGADIRDRRRKIEDACLSFWIAMFDHELKADEHESGIMSALAVLGLDTQKGGWMPATNYTPILSAMVTVVRALVVYSAYKKREDEVQRLR